MFRSLLPPTLLLLLILGPSTPAQAGWQSEVSQAVLDDPALAERGFFVLLAEQADLSAASGRTKYEKGEIVFRSLTRVADRTQPALVAELESLQVSYERFWIVNAIRVDADREIARQVALRPDVDRILRNSPFTVPELETEEREVPKTRRGGLTYGWNIDKMEAWRVWDAGYSGQGAVVGSIDTGVAWDLPELIDQYRGWNGSTADHNYNWHDAIDSGGTTCPAGSLEPCDEFNHGTATLALAVAGQLVGDSSTDQIGVAPQAKWMTCRAAVSPFDGSGTLASAMECLQWMLAPTDLNDQNPDPSRAPDVLNTSWGCLSMVGCADPFVLESILNNLRAAGIFLAAAAGNDGSDCETVQDSPPMFPSATATGSSGVDSTLTELISAFSSRGPAVATGLVKPDVVAPGQGIASFNRLGDPITVNGTSAASPHLAGEVALLISASPALAGNVDALETLVEQYADPMTATQTCGGVPGTEIPNNTWGWGRINAWNSYLGILASTAAPVVSDANGVELSPGRPNPSRGLTRLEYSVPAPAAVSLAIHDVAGRKIRELVGVKRQGPGSFSVAWDGRDQLGKSVAAGVYFACLRVGSVVRTRRVHLVR